MSLTVRICIALVAALALGTLVSATDIPGLRALPSLVEPVGALWVNAIRMTVIPLVVSLVITGIVSARDSRTVGRVGGGAVLLFALLVAASTIYGLLAAPPVLALLRVDPAAADALRASAAASGAAAELPPFRNWLVELVPSNPIRAAADGAMLPLVVFTVLFALAIARTAGIAPASLVEGIRTTMASLDPDLPVRKLQPAQATVAEANHQWGLLGSMLSFLAVLGLGLASLGIYGVITRTTAQRIGEFGIRLALGALARDIARLVLVSGAKLAVLGSAIGLLGAFGISRLFAAVFPNMQTSNVAVLSGVTLLLVAVALVACYVPARTASRTSPTETLRAL
jgi:Na+/H+-dicarboxylate symporter